MTLRKFSFLCAVAVFVSMAGCSKTNYGSQNDWGIADDETLRLEEPGGNILYPVSGSVYKAIDPRYIANKYGTTKELSGIKSFQLIALYQFAIPELIGNRPYNSVNSGQSWNYYINGKKMSKYARILVSALKLQAIEKVEYAALDTNRFLSIYSYDSYNNPPVIPEKIEHGAVRFYTRDISKGITPDRSTLYLLDDSIITREIFEAINPVFIRSLQRITNREELARYDRKNIKEIVEIKTFDVLEVTLGFPVREKSGPGNRDRDDSVIVDGIKLPSDVRYILNSAFFKEKTF